ncbi:hypothetical protein ACHAXS_004328, partial [Conticribra weissflogii]
MTALFENSHDGGSPAAIRNLSTFFLLWEALFQSSRFLIELVSRNRPAWILDESLLLDEAIRRGSDVDDGAAGAAATGGTNGVSVGNNSGGNAHETTCNRHNHPDKPTHDSSQNPPGRARAQLAKRTLIQQGPSYVVSLVHSLYVTLRGIRHISSLYNAPKLDKVFITRTHFRGSHRPAHLDVANTNIVFFSYLLYDLLHVILQYPKLGKIDTVVHHLVFASCSAINGTYGVMPFPFGWLIVGEASTIFLNWRWFLRASGRGGGGGGRTMKKSDDVDESDDCVGQKKTMDAVNSLFAFTFVATRIVLYSVGMIHLFGFGWEEVKQLSRLSGVP